MPRIAKFRTFFCKKKSGGGPQTTPDPTFNTTFSFSSSVLLYFTFLSHLFSLSCGAGSTVPREGFDLSVTMYYAFFLVCCGCHTSYIVSVHIQCQASIYTRSLSCRHSWRVRLANQETLIFPGTWSHLWFAGVRECLSWCSIVGTTVTVHQFFCILHLYKEVYLHNFQMCVLLIVQLLRGVGKWTRLITGQRYQLCCCSYSKWPSLIAV